MVGVEHEVTIENLYELVGALLESGVEHSVWLGCEHSDGNGVTMYFGPDSTRHELSIRWGVGNYGSARTNPSDPRRTVELALFNKAGDYLFDGDVLGWQSFSDIAAIASVVASGEVQA